MSISFDRQSVDRIRICEDTEKSQRVEKFSVWANGARVFEGTIIGFNRIAVFEPVVTDRLTVKIEQCRKEPYIKTLQAVATGAYRVK